MRSTLGGVLVDGSFGSGCAPVVMGRVQTRTQALTNAAAGSPAEQGVIESAGAETEEGGRGEIMRDCRQHPDRHARTHA
jgi:hypothetical protein